MTLASPIAAAAWCGSWTAASRTTACARPRDSGEASMKSLASLRESLIDGVVDMRAHPSRSLLQLVGIVLGVASVVSTFGLIEGGKRKMTAFFDNTGGIRKMI